MGLGYTYFGKDGGEDGWVVDIEVEIVEDLRLDTGLSLRQLSVPVSLKLRAAPHSWPKALCRPMYTSLFLLHSIHRYGNTYLQFALDLGFFLVFGDRVFH